VESGERAVIGVNRFPSETEPLEVFAVDPDVEAAQIAAVGKVRADRDDAAVESALSALREAAEGRVNVVPATVAAVRVYATIAEIVSVLRSVHGSWHPTAAF
jgi:methylmalonyl-CoA mutase N-terminal domain/subunit